MPPGCLVGHRAGAAARPPPAPRRLGNKHTHRHPTLLEFTSHPLPDTVRILYWGRVGPNVVTDHRRGPAAVVLEGKGDAASTGAARGAVAARAVGCPGPRTRRGPRHRRVRLAAVRARTLAFPRCAACAERLRNVCCESAHLVHARSRARSRDLCAHCASALRPRFDVSAPRLTRTRRPFPRVRAARDVAVLRT